MPKKIRFLLSFFLFFIISQLVFVTNTQFAAAKADEIVLKDTGEIILIMPDNSVLAASTSTADNKPASSNPPSSSNQSKPAPPAPSSAPKTKSESLTPQNSKATININPQPTTDNKIKVTVTPQNKPAPPSASTQQQPKTPSSQAVPNITSPGPQPQQTSGPSPSPLPTTGTPPPPITKLVDRVTEQGADGNTILSVQPGDNKITFQQGQTEVSTTLPIQIDNQTHQLSTISSNGPQKISILPNEAIAGATSLGIISNKQNTAAPTVTLAEVDNQVVYKIEGQKTGKLLGIFNISSNVEVDISAQNGTPVKTSQPLLLRAFGFLIK